MKMIKVISGLATGVTLHITYITSPIHEAGHMIVLFFLGIPSTYSWRTVTYYATLHGASEVIMGWSGILMECFMPLLIYWIFKQSKYVLFKYTALGIALSTYLSAFSYTDVIKLNYVGLGFWYIFAGLTLLSVIRSTGATFRRYSHI